MRIIAGDLRGRTIRSPQSDTTRPIIDRVKGSVFNSLQCRLAPAGFAGLITADLFSGTGSMGLEVLSRGAAWCTFVEQDRQAAKLLAENLAEFSLQSRSRIERIDLLHDNPAPPPAPAATYDLLFVDPPYRFSLDCSVKSPIGLLISRLAPLSTFTPARQAILVLRTMRGSRIADQIPGWQRIDQDVTGTMQVDWFVRVAVSAQPAALSQGTV